MNFTLRRLPALEGKVGCVVDMGRGVARTVIKRRGKLAVFEQCMYGDDRHGGMARIEELARAQVWFAAGRCYNAEASSFVTSSKHHMKPVF